MTIIPVSLLQSELPPDATDKDRRITNAVNRASGKVNTWTSKRYDSWDNYDSTNNIPRAPDDIVQYCLDIGKALWNKSIGNVYRDGSEELTWQEMIDNAEEDLKEIKIPPEFKTQTISLDSNDNMLIGSRTTTTGIFTRVIPANAFITSAGSSVYVPCEDFYIRKGGSYDDEYPDAWYLDTMSTSAVEGTLSYMRTYRKDMGDYLTYSK